MGNILIIDDDEMLCEMLCRRIHDMEHKTICAHTLSQGLKVASESAFDIVLLDVRLPDGNGLDALSSIKSSATDPEVLIITGEGDENGAELAIKNGAWDYIQKPLSSREIALQLTRALEYRQEKMVRLKAVSFDRHGIIGESRQIRACLDKTAQSAATDVNVLIVGETGTGKELFANAIHRNSSRAGSNFVVVDCAALPENLVESVLFGHVKGAFTGASENTAGLVKQADRGTLFLDEVGELPLATQKAFLRALQERSYRQVGGTTEISSNFRLIAATHRDLEKLCAESLFRKDLYYRLKSVLIELPALRERKSDLQVLMLYYINKLCIQYAISTKGFSPEFFEALSKHDWPGNVRELVHVLESALIVCKDWFAKALRFCRPS